MPPDALETLRQVNRNLRSALLRLRPERKHCSTIRSREFSDLRSQLRRAAECLRRLPVHSEPAAEIEAAGIEATEIERESLEYRTNLAQLKQFLPDVHVRLLAEKSRLETARTHLAAAAAWARASKEML
jgi:hypothetical protein